MIHFAKNELILECLEESWCECALPCENLEEHYKHKSSKTMFNQLFDGTGYLFVSKEWRRIVEKYTTLHLTLNKDRLPAISAVAKRLGVTFDSRLGKYLGGLWERSLDRDFMWVNSRSWGFNVRTRQVGSRLSGPTWSWASIDAAVKFPADGEVGLPCHFIKFIGSEVTPSGPDEYEELQSGKLFISGFLKSGVLQYSDTDSPALTDASGCFIDSPSVIVDCYGYYLHLDYDLHVQVDKKVVYNEWFGKDIQRSAITLV